MYFVHVFLKLKYLFVCGLRIKIKFCLCGEPGEEISWRSSGKPDEWYKKKCQKVVAENTWRQISLLT